MPMLGYHVDTEGNFSIVMPERVSRARTLTAWLVDKRANGGVSSGEALTIVWHVVSGLQYMHGVSGCWYCGWSLGGRWCCLLWASCSCCDACQCRVSRLPRCCNYCCDAAPGTEQKGQPHRSLTTESVLVLCEEPLRVVIANVELSEEVHKQRAGRSKCTQQWQWADGRWA